MDLNSSFQTRYERIQNGWNLMTVYERFEQGIALILTGLIAVVIVLATLELCYEILRLVIADRGNRVDHRLFQTLFGQVMTVLIALELKHSILRVVARKENIVQVKTVLLIGLLAISRKFIVLDLNEVQAEMVLALSVSVIALAIAYWIVRGREVEAPHRDRLEPQLSKRSTAGA